MDIEINFVTFSQVISDHCHNRNYKYSSIVYVLYLKVSH